MPDAGLLGVALNTQGNEVPSAIVERVAVSVVDVKKVTVLLSA